MSHLISSREDIPPAGGRTCDYSADQSSVIMNITGNIISRQVNGETSKILSEQFGKINQVKESISINRTDTSVCKSSQLDFANPQSRIAGLSSGEFVGMVADDPANKIKLKTFHCEIINNHELLNAEANSHKDLPVISEVTAQMVNDNFRTIKAEIANLIETEIERILNTPGLDNLRK